MTDLVAYVLMRTDLDSMNAGKGMAHSHHAYGAMKADLRKRPRDLTKLYLEWQMQTDQDFGTTITLGGSEAQIERAVYFANHFLADKVAAGWVLDTSYPITDGSITHLLPLRTCAYLFGHRGDCRHAVGHLTRHL